MSNQPNNKLSDVTFYDYPWDGPTVAVVERGGQFYDVRQGWGCQEGWTNSHIVLPLSDEEVEQYAENLIEIDDQEVEASFGEDTLDGILEAVRGE